MTLSERLRNAAAGTPGPTPRASGPPPDAPGSRTPGRPEHPAGLPGVSPRPWQTRRRRRATPASPAERSARYGQPPYLPWVHGAGMAAAYGRTILPDPYRPEPVGRAVPADTSSLVRDGFNPWRGRPREEPPGPPVTFRERVARLWYGDEA
jgi:hypothetical protein